MSFSSSSWTGGRNGGGSAAGSGGGGQSSTDAAEAAEDCVEDTAQGERSAAAPVQGVNAAAALGAAAEEEELAAAATEEVFGADGMAPQNHKGLVRGAERRKAARQGFRLSQDGSWKNIFNWSMSCRRSSDCFLELRSFRPLLEQRSLYDVKSPKSAGKSGLGPQISSNNQRKSLIFEAGVRDRLATLRVPRAK